MGIYLLLILENEVGMFYIVKNSLEKERNYERKKVKRLLFLSHILIMLLKSLAYYVTKMTKFIICHQFYIKKKKTLWLFPSSYSINERKKKRVCIAVGVFFSQIILLEDIFNKVSSYTIMKRSVWLPPRHATILAGTSSDGRCFTS